jgi:hypothetical protein
MALTEALKDLTKTEIAGKLEALKSRTRNAMEKAKKPVKQISFGLAAVAGGAAGGAVAGMKPSISKVPTDLGLGVLIALPCAFAAGSDAADALAMAGYGMVSGAASRGTAEHTRDWRETRAAEKGDVAAQNIVALQKQLNQLRKDRDTPAAKK